MSAKQKSGLEAPGGGLFCWPHMRTAALAAALIVLLAPDAQAHKPQARRPWLLFPIDVRRFDRVSSRFGMRRLAGHRQLHRGVDLVAPSGSWVVAAREGRVAEAGRARACGWYVTVEHANAWRTVYCHLKADARTLGNVQGLAVPAMGVVGEGGSTGHSTGPHLHFRLVGEGARPPATLRALYTPAETLQVLRHMGLAR